MSIETALPSGIAAMQIDAAELIDGPSGSTSTGTNPAPNTGLSQPDFEAIGDDRASKAEWLRERNVDLAARVIITKLAHMRYQHPDLQEITRFLKDFGLHVVKETETERWFQGYGPDQYVYHARQGPKAFLGGVFEVESVQDLEKVLQIPNVKVLSKSIEALADAPGGGSIVTVEDPEGFPVSFMHGQTALSAPQKLPEKLILNYETEKPRQRKFQRFQLGPAEVYKLGHFGMVVTKFDELKDWYTRYFNIVPSDILYIPMPQSSSVSLEKRDDSTPRRKEVAMFAHIDRGTNLVDHHTLFLSSAAPGKSKHVHHCSFEVHDFDTQALGHQWLAKQGYSSVWGVGRHILGSQIFDYWWDTTGNMVEHYADGDLVNIETPMAYGPAGHEGLAVWGPEVPKAFLD